MAWQKVASLQDFGDRDVIGIELDGAAVALFRLGDEVRATSGICTHEFADLDNGFVEADDGTVECPLHQALFDIRSGRVLCAPASENLKVYKVKIEGGDVFVDPASAEAADARTASAAKGQSREPAPAASAHNGNGAQRSDAPSGNGGALAQEYVWPDNDLSLIPDWVYTDQFIYEREIER